jgi:hypothetical protein
MQYRTINLYRGRGDGTFQSIGNQTFAESPNNVALADVNADGEMDLVVTFGRQVRVLLGDGTGVFAEEPARSVSFGEQVAWSQVRELNGDGRPELLVLTFSGWLMIYDAAPDGRWGGGPGDRGEQHSVALDTGPGPSWFEVVDLEGDGYLDIMTRSAANEVRLHRGRASR